MLEVIKDKIRVYMNDIADHMAGGGCQDHEEYIRLVGVFDSKHFEHLTMQLTHVVKIGSLLSKLHSRLILHDSLLHC